MMIQLNPPIPLVTEDGQKCTAFLALDYSQEHELLLLVGMRESRQLWFLPHKRLRLDENVSLDRFPRERSAEIALLEGGDS